MSELFKNGNHVSEMLTNQEITLSLSDAFNLLESNLYETIEPDKTAMLATAMAHLAQTILTYRASEKYDAEYHELRENLRKTGETADNPGYNAEDLNFEDMPPEDYNPDDESGDKPIYDGESMGTFGGAES